MEQIQEHTTSKGKKIILISFGVLAAGFSAYFGYEHWKKKKEEKASADDTTAPDMNLSPPSKGSFSIPSAPLRNDDFPLKKGSKGSKVKQMQEVLISKLGSSILGKSGADGDFGSKTEATLIKAGYPSSIDESTFNIMVQGDAASFDADAIATELYNAAAKKDFPNAIKSLQKLNSKEDYTSVSESFKNNYHINGVRQTLVNGMLNSFSDAKQKQSIRLQFSRMGLNYDGKKWSLSGIDTCTIITKEQTLVWVNPKCAIKVPANMVLGKELAQKGEHTLFENNGKCFLVQTQSITCIA